MIPICTYSDLTQHLSSQHLIWLKSYTTNTSSPTYPAISIQNIFWCHHTLRVEILRRYQEILVTSQQDGEKINLQNCKEFTRTLDAFQHYVVAKSQSQLLIADLQGKKSSLQKF